jgi:hypothetical protein
MGYVACMENANTQGEVKAGTPEYRRRLALVCFYVAGVATVRAAEEYAYGSRYCGNLETRRARNAQESAENLLTVDGEAV